MPLTSPKGSLPLGWSVQTSKNYPGRIYYFNNITGDSSWECPELNPPRLLLEEENEKVGALIAKEATVTTKEDAVTANGGTVTIKKGTATAKKAVVSPKTQVSNIADDSLSKPFTPPTAVVVPVVNKKRHQQLDSQKKLKKQKKIDCSSECNEEKFKGVKASREEKKINKKRKAVSPLNKTGLKQDVIQGKVDAKNSLMEELKESPSTSESNIRDVEMRDVSLDLDNLTERKETVFDSSASYYIIVDTNVLIGEINLINELKDTPVDGCGPPHIFIPWVVIEELDKLKSQRNAKGGPGAASCEAIRYLNSVLGKHPRFHGQSPQEAEEWAKTYSKCNDDKLLECCMALHDRMPAEKVILLTNDKNLVNKALICKINVHNFETLMEKVKPDTVFNYNEIKMGVKKKREKVGEESKSTSLYVDASDERLHRKRDIFKRDIHALLSDARLLLKDVVSKFFSAEMEEAYGNIWENFHIETKLLKGLLEGINRYWRAVFSEFFTPKDKRNFELLLEKSSRPEGFFGDKDECLVIFSAIEDVFRQIQKRQPCLNVPVELIQDYRVQCVNAFTAYYEAESSIKISEEKSIHNLLDANWDAINQLCGILLDQYKVPHDLSYDKIDNPLPEFEIKRIMTILYPGVEQFKKLLKSIHDAVKTGKPVNKFIKNFNTALLEFIPSLKLPYEPQKYPFLTRRALERFFTSSQNGKMVEIGIEQIEKFHSLLDELLRVMLSPRAEFDPMEL